MKAEYLATLERQSRWVRFGQLADAAQFDHEKRAMRPLRFGDAVFVDREFCRIVRSAAAALPNTTLAPELLFASTAWVWLAEPLVTHAYQINAMGWEPELMPSGLPGVAFMTYSAIGPKRPEAWLSPSRMVLLVGADYDELLTQETRVKATMDGIRWWLSFLLLVNQRLFRMRRLELDRRERGRVERPGREVDHIQVVTLRRIHPETGDGERDVEWSCRWIVRGHWRQQFFPASHTHRPIWIAPYPKGPEDKPLKDDQRRLFAAVR